MPLPLLVEQQQSTDGRCPACPLVRISRGVAGLPNDTPTRRQPANHTPPPKSRKYPPTLAGPDIARPGEARSSSSSSSTPPPPPYFLHPYTRATHGLSSTCAVRDFLDWSECFFVASPRACVRRYLVYVAGAETLPGTAIVYVQVGSTWVRRHGRTPPPPPPRGAMGFFSFCRRNNPPA